MKSLVKRPPFPRPHFNIYTSCRATQYYQPSESSSAMWKRDAATSNRQRFNSIQRAIRLWHCRIDWASVILLCWLINVLQTDFVANREMGRIPIVTVTFGGVLERGRRWLESYLIRNYRHGMKQFYVCTSLKMSHVHFFLPIESRYFAGAKT